MAKVKFGAIVTDMRNKLGSQVYSRNRFGPYTRSFKATITSNTAAQIIARNRLSTFSASWKTLTQDERNAWNGSVESFRHTDIFGDLIRPSGFDLYVRLNCNLDQISQAPLIIPPIPQAMQGVSSLSVVASQGSNFVSITFLPAAVPTDHTYILTATPCISAGISYVKNLVRAISVLPSGTASPFLATADYLAKFGSITTGDRISVQIIAVNNISGQKLKPFNATCIVSDDHGLDFDEALDTGIPLT